MAIEQYQNNASTTLNGAINNSVTSIVVTLGSVFPSVGNFRIICEDEIMICTARSTNTLTVTRGQEGTSAASHADLTAIRHGLTSASFLKLLSEGILRGTYANLPAAGRAGRVYHATDNPFVYYDNGSSWDVRMPGMAMDFNPNLTSFATWLNQDSAAIATTKGYQVLTPLTGQANSTERWHGRIENLSGGASSNFTFTFAYSVAQPPGGIIASGIILRNSSNSRFMNFGPSMNAATPQLAANTWSGPTAFNANVFGDNHFVGYTQQVHLIRLTSDGTNYGFYWSNDGGSSWILHKNVAISGSYVAGYDQIGFGYNNFSQNNSSQEFQMNVYHAFY